jgi:cytochrome P450
LEYDTSRKARFDRAKITGKVASRPNGASIIGETLGLIFNSEFILKRRDRYGCIFKSHILGKPTVFMTGPEAVHFVISSLLENFSWREGVPQQFRTLLGNGLPFQDGEEHRRTRQLMKPAFHGRALSSYIDTMEAITLKYLDNWERLQEFP